MGKETVDVVIEGGKATAAPPLGPALGPKGVNIGKVVADINKKTADFKGMKVPVKVIIDDETKEYEITVGTPPASQLIKKELGLSKGGSNIGVDVVADLSVEQAIKISNMKADAVLGNSTKARVLEIVGTARSMSVSFDGLYGDEAVKKIKSGAYDDKFKANDEKN